MLLFCQFIPKNPQHLSFHRCCGYPFSMHWLSHNSKILWFLPVLPVDPLSYCKRSSSSCPEAFSYRHGFSKRWTDMLHNTQHHKDIICRKQKFSEKKICFAITIPLLQSIYNSYFIQNLSFVPDTINHYKLAYRHPW